jgi:hypothetical protein
LCALYGRKSCAVAHMQSAERQSETGESNACEAPNYTLRRR